MVICSAIAQPTFGFLAPPRVRFVTISNSVGCELIALWSFALRCEHGLGLAIWLGPDACMRRTLTGCSPAGRIQVGCVEERDRKQPGIRVHRY